MSRISKIYDVNVTIRGTICGRSQKAIKFEILAITGRILPKPTTEWFPLSQLKKEIRGDMQGEDELVVTEWILKEKGLIPKEPVTSEN
jgi:hypothetical protein